MKKKRKSGYLLLLFLIVLGIFLLLVPYLMPNDPNATDLSKALQPPDGMYPLGTDALGRCMLSRILYGAKVSIGSSLIIIAVVFTMGTAIGVIAGYMGGMVDQILDKCITVMQAFPKFILAIAITGILGIGIKNAMIALCVVEWTSYARMARSLTKGIKKKQYIQAAKICGEGDVSIMCHHILPNLLPVLVVNASLGISSMIMEVAALSYLGMGVESPMAEWGAMMNAGKDYMQTNAALVLIPGIAIFVTAFVFNLIGENMRDQMNGGKNEKIL